MSVLNKKADRNIHTFLDFYNTGMIQKGKVYITPQHFVDYREEVTELLQIVLNTENGNLPGSVTREDYSDDKTDYTVYTFDLTNE